MLSSTYEEGLGRPALSYTLFIDVVRQERRRLIVKTMMCPFRMSREMVHIIADKCSYEACGSSHGHVVQLICQRSTGAFKGCRHQRGHVQGVEDKRRMQ